MSVRDFKTAANLFLDTVSTFTSYELMDYKAFVRYTVYTSIISLPRNQLRDKVNLLVNVQCTLFLMVFVGISKITECFRNSVLLFQETIECDCRNFIALFVPDLQQDIGKCAYFCTLIICLGKYLNTDLHIFFVC